MGQKMKRQMTLATIVLCVTLFLVVREILAASKSGSWYKNGLSMSGYHNADFTGVLDRYMDASSSASSSLGATQYLDVVGLLEDRCKNSNGTWKAWTTFASNAAGRNWSTSVSIHAQGQYQTCSYGHEYRNRSKHAFQMDSLSVNEYHWLCSASGC